MPIRPIEIMEKHTYDPNKDGLIAIAQLETEVATEGEVDAKVAVHKGDTSAHHAKTTSFADITDRAGASKLNWDSGKLLKGAGIGADPTPIDVPGETGNSILEKLQKHPGVWWFNNNWLPADMINSGVSGSGAFSWISSYVESSTGTTSGSYARLTKLAKGLSNAYSWGKKRFFGVLV